MRCFPTILCVLLAGGGALAPGRGNTDAPPHASSLLSNGGFESGSGSGAPGWTAHGRGFEIDRQVRHSGAQGIRCRNPTGEGEMGARAQIRLDQQEPAPVLVSGWSRAEDVGGARDEGYSLYVDLEYTDGTPLWGQVASFTVGTHDWQRRQLLITPTRPVRSVMVYALFRHHSGTAWFDDFEAREIRGPGVFDGQPIGPPPRSLGIAPQKVEPGVVARGLSLGVSPSGEINDVHVGSADVTARYAGGFFVRDVGAGGNVTPLRGTVKSGAAYGLRLDLASTALGIRCSGTIRPAEDAIDFQGQLTVTGSRERALTLYLAVPVRADGWTWGQDVRRAQTVRPDREYSHQARVGAGATGALSLYPFAALTGPKGGLGIADQVDHPDVCRIFYSGAERKLVVAWDVATRAKPSSRPIPFRCTLFPLIGTGAADGFRAAAARFYRLNGERYRRRARAEGIWMPFTDPAQVPHPEDFGIAYHEGDHSVASDDRLGILSFRYTEPMTYWMAMPPAMPRTYDNAVALLKKNAASGTGETREMSRAVLNSGTWDENGHFNLTFRNEPWANGAVFVLNPSPQLPATAEQPTRGSLAYTREAADRRYAPDESKGQLDGEYLDSLESWGETLDFRPEHLDRCPYPLSFDPDQHRPVLPQWFSTYAFTRFLSDDLHRRGKLLMANTTPVRFSVFAPVLDVMGIEVNWKQGDRWNPDTDEVMCLRRTLSGTKPYLLLMNTDFRRFTAADVDRYFQRSLFYGIYPSMFSADAATHPYWQDSALYERDRPAFRNYLPIIRTLSRSGWQPVTHARAGNGAVWVERFGTDHFTLFNPTDQPVETELTVDASALGRKGSPGAVRELVSGNDLAARSSGGKWTITVRLEPETVGAIEFGTPSAK